LKIELLHYTPIEPLIKATAMPYQSKETKGLVKRVFENGHKSVVRHGMASFLITDVSQSLLRQISRHPFINLTVKSSRYCDMSGANVYIPLDNLNKLNDSVEDILDEYIFDMEKMMDIYKKWKFYEGNQKEVDVAKLFLPLASTTDLVMSGNYQALYEFLQLRNCVRSEGEIRQLSLEITKIMKEVLPEIFGELGCRGDELKMCTEFNACGKYSRREE
jgi:thymidylate synthase (FAD)